MSDTLKHRCGRPKGSGDRDGPALRQITALCTADKTLSQTAAIKRVIVNKQLVKNVADPINNVRRLRYKLRLLARALHLGPDEEEPFDPARHANAKIGKRTWMNSQDAERWEKAGRAGWMIERGWFGNREHVCKIRRDLQGVLIREDDPAEVTLYLERFVQIGFRFSVGIDGEVSVWPPAIVGHGLDITASAAPST